MYPITSQELVNVVASFVSPYSGQGCTSTFL